MGDWINLRGSDKKGSDCPVHPMNIGRLSLASSPGIFMCQCEPNTDDYQQSAYSAISIFVQDLEGRLARYQGKCDQLQLQNDELQKQLHQQLDDQEQMITFLKKKGQDQTEAYMDLEEKLAAIIKVGLSHYVGMLCIGYIDAIRVALSVQPAKPFS